MELIESMEPADYHPEMKASVVGAYRDFLEVRRLIGDVLKATFISLGLVLLMLIGFFRNLRSVIVVTVPLLFGVAWSLLAVTVAFGSLNTLTAFIFSMLIGIGIDFGIHFYQRALQEYSIGSDWERAVYVSLSRTGRALLTASMTTILSLLVLLIASFDGFREFGVACAIGIALCLAATVLVGPPLIAAIERVRPSRRHSRFQKKEGQSEPRGVHTIMRVAMLVVVLLAAFGFASAQDASFEYDFRNLRGPSSGSGISYGSAVGDNRSAAPSIMLGESREQMREVHEILKERLAEGDPYLEGFVTIETFVPSEQDERMDLIDQIYDVLDKRAVRNIEGENGELVDTMLELTDTGPFTFEELPDYVKDELVESDGSFGKLGLVYTDADWWNVLDVRKLQKHYSTIETSQGEVRIASSGYILDNVVRYVQADAERLAIAIVIVLFIVLLLDLRSLFAALACLIALAGAVGMTVGLMATFDLKLGLYNMIVLPTILGVGIDGAIHLYHRYLEEGYDNLWYALSTTGTAVAASSLTTAAGFAGLLFANHKGVETIGWLALAGIVSALVAVLTLLPGMISFFGNRAPRNPFETADYRTVSASDADSEDTKKGEGP
jgi:predicted RND superfamily exporter protein